MTAKLSTLPLIKKSEIVVFEQNKGNNMDNQFHQHLSNVWSNTRMLTPKIGPM